ncbi:MAG: DUF2817 domain-containing protein [Phocaeicola sp.]|nr:DUF2817 domain-containing protein [Phocaeicola sp.]
MATKTFEELKQMAIQIRDEKANKQNTATRIGTQMLEHLNKLEQEYYDKTNIDDKIEHIQIESKNKGYYQTKELLLKKYPNPSDGDTAWVGTPYPGNVYDVVDGQWHDTGIKAGGNDSGTTDYTELENKPTINNIELSGNKTLDDFGIASKNDLENKQDNIDEISIEVDSNVGIPSGSAEFNGGSLNLSFKNLKGQKGDIGPKGNTGKTGPQGLQGPQGNSGITGSPEDMVVVNNLNGGESETGSIKVLAAEQGKVIDDKITYLDKNKLDCYIIGRGTTYSSINFNAKEGRTYCITLHDLEWPIAPETSASLFYLGVVDGGLETEILSVTSFASMKQNYVFTAKAGVEVYKIGGRAAENSNIYFTIEDITYTNRRTDMNYLNVYDLNSRLYGTIIPVNKSGYIPYDVMTTTINTDNIQDSVNYLHTIIECKLGETYYILGKGGNESRLFLLTDTAKKVITYADVSVDYSEKGYLFRPHTNGYLIIAANVSNPIKVIKIDDDFKNKALSLNLLPYLYLDAGYIDYQTGQRLTSSANMRTKYMPTLGFNRLKVTVNVSTSYEALTPGLAFYDINRQYISGVQCLYGDIKGYETVDIDIPKNAYFFASTIYTDYKNYFKLELYNQKFDENINYQGGSFSWEENKYIDFMTGEEKLSSVNNYVEFNVKGIPFMDVTLNKTPQGTSPGLAFYDEKGNFITGYAPSNFGSALQEATYATHRVIIPANAYICKTSFRKNLKKYWKAILYTEVTSGYKGIENNYEVLRNITTDINIGSPVLYESANTANEYTSLNKKTVDELYSIYDELVSNYPLFFKKGSNLATVSGYEIRQYELGFNSPYIIDHEPAKDEVISSNLWIDKYKPKTILINVGMHGNEKTAIWGAALAFKDILESTEDWANYIKSNVLLKIIPCLNPWGFQNDKRYNANTIDLNREGSESEPERIAYMNWINDNQDAMLIIDIHGTQGRYAYTPIIAESQIYEMLVRNTTKIAAALNKSYKSFYDSINPGYGEKYSPYIVNKYTKESSRGLCFKEILQRFGMPGFTIETPDNIAIVSNGNINEDLSGLLEYSDLRNCKITKDILINMIQLIISVPKVNKIEPTE